MVNTSPGQPTHRTPKWPTHLSLSGEVILATAVSTENVHEITTLFYSKDREEHSAMLNVWAREVPDQGVYLINNVPFATEPLRLGVGDAEEMRMIPHEIDGGEPGSPCLPVGVIFLTGIGVVAAADADGKGGTVMGFTYQNKKHQWTKFILRVEYEDTPRWASWYVSPARSLVHFDAIINNRNEDGVVRCFLRKMTTLDNGPRPLLEALDVTGAGGGNRAERLREAHRANRASQTTGTNVGGNGSGGAQAGSNGDTSTKGKGKHTREEEIDAVEDGNNDDIEEVSVSANDKEAGPSTPTARKIRRTVPNKQVT